MGRLCCKAPASAARLGRRIEPELLKNRGTTQIARRTVRQGHSTAPLTRAYENGYRLFVRKPAGPAGSLAQSCCKRKRFPRFCSEATAPARPRRLSPFPALLSSRPGLAPAGIPAGVRRQGRFRRTCGKRTLPHCILILYDYSRFRAGCQTFLVTRKIAHIQNVRAVQMLAFHSRHKLT